jgi:hypothetical protein
MVMKELYSSLKENINILHNNYPDAADRFEDGKVFQLNQCYHSGSGVFYPCQHLTTIGAIKKNCLLQIVFGYVVRKTPFGSQLGNTVIENNSIWSHD